MTTNFAAGSIAGAATDSGIGGFGQGEAGRVALHAVAGCASGAVAGGSCGRQAAAGAFSEVAGPIIAAGGDQFAYRVVAHSVAGGLGSITAGGKFENGAVTGAFGYLFNQAAHAPALQGFGAGAASEGLVGGLLSRLFGPLSLAVVPSQLGDSSIYQMYRVVGPAEFADIQTTGQFAFAPGMMEAKQFATNLSDAQYFRSQVLGSSSRPTNSPSFVPPSPVQLGVCSTRRRRISDRS